MIGENENNTQQFTICLFSGIIDSHMGILDFLPNPSLKNIT
jgi:hypothetical protein